MSYYYSTTASTYGHYSYPGTENKPFFSYSILRQYSTNRRPGNEHV
jgi:hypothetical protein